MAFHTFDIVINSNSNKISDAKNFIQGIVFYVGFIRQLTLAYTQSAFYVNLYRAVVGPSG